MKLEIHAGGLEAEFIADGKRRHHVRLSMREGRSYGDTTPSTDFVCTMDSIRVPELIARLQTVYAEYEAWAARVTASAASPAQLPPQP